MWKNIADFEPYFRVNVNNTRSGDYYAPGRQRLTLNQRQSIIHQALVNWDSIPMLVKNSPSLISFKKKYKNDLLSSHFN